MKLEESFKKVGVVGAAGKMGRGIASVISIQLVFDAIERGDLAECYVVLHDIDRSRLLATKAYLRKQTLRFAEKNIVRLRKLYQTRQDLIENGDMVDAFCHDVESSLLMVTSLSEMSECSIVFEAALEIAELKMKVLSELKASCRDDVLILTNTSSIPIHFLEKESSLEGRIVGFHFYNPPPVQKLVELIFSSKTSDDCRHFCEELGKQLGKKLILSNDIAGFIGNGQFIREGLYALQLLSDYAKNASIKEASLKLDYITEHGLVRPMGILRLIDYVGIDVFNMIVGVMNEHISEERLEEPLLQTLLDQGICGGQSADASQKDGFFKYEKNKTVAVYDWKDKRYEAINEDDQTDLEQALGALPDSHQPWKTLSRSRDKENMIARYYQDLMASTEQSAQETVRYLKACDTIAKGLVERGVAQEAEDVDQVMVLGFHHIVGPLFFSR